MSSRPAKDRQLAGIFARLPSYEKGRHSINERAHHPNIHLLYGTPTPTDTLIRRQLLGMQNHDVCLMPVVRRRAQEELLHDVYIWRSSNVYSPCAASVGYRYKSIHKPLLLRDMYSWMRGTQTAKKPKNRWVSSRGRDISTSSLLYIQSNSRWLMKL